MDGFKGRIVLVTGGSAGMGLATARLLIERGATVVATGRTADKLAAARRSLDRPEAMVPIVADCARLTDIDALVERVRQQYGRLDGVFANAGLGLFKPFTDFSEADFDFLVGVNYKGVFFTIQRLLPLVRAGGAIVINASWTQYRGLANATLYASTKGALLPLVKGLAVELAPRDIRVNSVSPGYVNTEQFNEQDLPPAVAATMRSQVPSGRFGRPEEVAQAVAFLLSDAATYVNGQDWVIDAGLTAVHRPQPT